MNKKKNFDCKSIAIVLILILSIVNLVLVLEKGESEIQEIEYKYSTILIKLNSTNDFSYVDGEIVDYTCDENVYFDEFGNKYYASTWEEDSRLEDKYKGTYGECFIKIRKKLRNIGEKNGQ